MFSANRKRFSRRLKEPFGKAGLTVAILALVLAMAGGAWAAAGLTGKQKKEVTKIAKKYAGSPGAPGPQGLTGAPGAAGKDGANGANGANGTNGSNGKSVELLAGAAGCGAPGGSTVQVEGEPGTAEEICNGETGFTETLPAGKTETGSLSFISGAAGSLGVIALPFNIPLSEPPTATFYNLPNSINCPGTVAEPKATPGKLCVYVEGNVFDATTEPEGVGHTVAFDRRYRAGGTLTFISHGANKVILGTYAVMPPTSP